MKTYVRFEGRRVAAYDAVGEGPPLICLPGGPGYAGDQLDLLGGLHAHRRLIRLDLRGAGESDEPPSRSWSLVDYSADLAIVPEHLGEARIDVFGHAHGGLVGAVYATQHPERVGWRTDVPPLFPRRRTLPGSSNRVSTRRRLRHSWHRRFGCEAPARR